MARLLERGRVVLAARKSWIYMNRGHRGDAVFLVFGEMGSRDEASASIEVFKFSEWAFASASRPVPLTNLVGSHFRVLQLAEQRTIVLIGQMIVGRNRVEGICFSCYPRTEQIRYIVHS